MVPVGVLVAAVIAALIVGCLAGMYSAAVRDWWHDLTGVAALLCLYALVAIGVCTVLYLVVRYAIPD